MTKARWCGRRSVLTNSQCDPFTVETLPTAVCLPGPRESTSARGNPSAVGGRGGSGEGLGGVVWGSVVDSGEKWGLGSPASGTDRPQGGRKCS